MIILNISQHLLIASVFSHLASTAFAAATELRNRSTQTLRIPMRQSVHGPSFNLTYGSPPQTMIMLDDWTWHSTWLYSPNCKGSFNVTDCVLPGQNYFNSQQSSTYRNTTDTIQTFGGTDYTAGAPFTVSFGTDTMCLPGLRGNKPLCREKTEVEISDLAFEFPIVEDIGGIFGLAPVLSGYNATYLPAPFQFMQAGLIERLVGWHMCHGLKNKDTCAGEDYLTIMGGTDHSIYDPSTMQHHKIITSPCINAGNLQLTPARDNYWSASWTGFWIGKTRISLATPTTAMPDPANPSCSSIDPVAIFDEGGLGHGAPIPLSAFSTLTAVTNATKISASAVPLNQGPQGLWTVSCAALDSLPNLVYELSGKQNITVVPSMYIDTKLMPRKCLLNARTWDRSAAGAQTFFGQTVLTRTYLRFNFEGLEVGVAPVKKELYL